MFGYLYVILVVIERASLSVMKVKSNGFFIS